MEKKRFYGFAVKMMAAVVCSVMNFGLLCSCDDDDYDVERVRAQSVEVIPDPEPEPEPIPGLNWILDRDSVNRGSEYESWWTAQETVTETKAAGRLLVSATHEKDLNAVFSRDSIIDLKYAQEHTTYGELKSELTYNSPAEKQWRYSQRVTAQLRDGGTLCHLDWNTVVSQLSVRDTMRWFPADSVGYDKPTVKNLRFIEETKTRNAEEYYVDKDHPIRVEVTWLVPVTTVHLAKNYSYTQEVRDTVTDFPLVKNDIVDAVVKDSTRTVVDDDTERCEFTIEYHHKDGSTSEASRSIILNRNIITIPEYLKTVKSFAYSWLRDEKLVIGTAAKAAGHKEDNWTVLGRTDKFSALITNSTEPVNTDYGYYHESALYKDEFVEINFDFVTPVMKEKKSWVESVESDDSYWDKARLYNTINTEYLNWKQEAQETVLLQKEAKRVTSESWDIANCTETVQEGKVLWHLVFKTVYSDGEVVNTPFDFSDDRYLELLSQWESEEQNETQSTSKATVSDVLNSKEMSDTQKGATAKWTRETREINSTATLYGSVQYNKWRATEPSCFEVEYHGQKFNFDRCNVSVANVASVSGGGIVGAYKVFKYGDVLTYVRANNTKTSTAPGTIKVLAKQILSEDWVTAQCTEKWTDNQVLWHLVYVVNYTNGETDTYTFDCSDERKLEVKSKWSSIEANANQTTDKPVVNITANTPMSASKDGAEFSWTRETRSITSKATLAASVQTNEWLAIDPFGMTVKFHGKTFSFERKNMNVSNGASVSGGNEVDGYKVYTYGDALSYSVGGNTKSATAPGEIKVTSETVVSEGWDAASAKEVISDLFVSWTLDWVIKYSTGREVRKTFTHNDSRSFTVKSNWSSIEANNNQSTSSAVATVVSTESKSQNVDGASFVWSRETRKITSSAKLHGSTQTNEWSSIEPIGCMITYKDKMFTFNRQNITVSNSASVGSGTTSGNYTVYPYGDALSYTYGSNTKSKTAPGEIKVASETVVSEGWDAASAKEVISDLQVSWTLDWVTKYSTGREDRKTFTHNDSRSFTVKSNWSSIEDDNSQNTSSAVASIVSTENKNKNVDGATFAWSRETRSITSKAKLCGSTQTNEWSSVEPIGCVVTYKDKTFTFNRQNITVSNNASVGAGVVGTDYTVYSYGDKLSYTYGSNTKVKTAPGEIKMEIGKGGGEPDPEPEPPFFPEEWGTIVAATATVANNERYSDYVYTWSLRFTNNRVLPVVVRVDATSPEWHFEYVEVTTVTNYNGGTYDREKGIWINTTAKDQPDQMVWSRDGSMKANRAYQEARDLKWDKGRVNSTTGKPSVKTPRFEFSISKGVLTVKDTDKGRIMGSWSSAY